MDKNQKVYLCLLVGATIWCLGIFAAPVLASWLGEHHFLATSVAGFYRPICHQSEAKSLEIMGRSLAVCSRCTAIYLAFLAGTVVWPAVRRMQLREIPFRWLVIAVLPTLADVVVSWLGIHEWMTVRRLASGALLGFSLALAILPIAIEGIGDLLRSEPIRLQIPDQRRK